MFIEIVITNVRSTPMGSYGKNCALSINIGILGIP